MKGKVNVIKEKSVRVHLSREELNILGPTKKNTINQGPQDEERIFLKDR